jgi:hypothetical protein
VLAHPVAVARPRALTPARRPAAWVGLLAAALLAAACGGTSAVSTPAASASATAIASTTAPPSDAPAPKPSATALASHVANPTPSAPAPPGSPAATDAPSDAPFPNPHEATLLAHVDATLRDGCSRADPFYADELDSISCGGDPQPFVDYTLFASVDELRAAFNDDVATSESQPAASGTCASGNYLSTYLLAGTVAGRIQCTTRTANGQTFRVIEWTREELRILAYLSSATATWEGMIAFWRSQAGPTS